MVTYLRILEELEADGEAHTSSQGLATLAGVTPSQVRKDLAYFGRFGTRGRGYAVALLRRELMRSLGLNQRWNVVIVGMGRLGQAIANYPGVNDDRFQQVGLFDVNPALIGKQIRDLTVQPVTALPDFVAQRAGTEGQVDIGFLTVPPQQAQQAAQGLVAAGVRGILNFAPVVLQPQSLGVEGGEGNVMIENVDFVASMKRLAFYMLNPQWDGSEREETV